MREALRALREAPRVSPSDRSPAIVQAAIERAVQSHDDPALLCALCGHAITKASAACEVDGAHEHVRTNPAGFTFRIRCFREAPGCAGEGEPTEHYSWFPGHAWQVALCRACGGHIGWVFRLDPSRFYGLINRRLVEGRGEARSP